MAPQATPATPATPTGPVVPVSTATEAPTAASLLPTFAPPSSPALSYYPLTTGSSTPLPAAESTSRVRPSSLSSSGARTLGAVLGTVIGLALLAIAVTSFFLCCRKRARSSAAHVYRNSSFHAGPAYPQYPTESAATSKEAFAHYRPSADAGASGSLQMSDLDLARGMPMRPPSVATYDDSPGMPVAYAKSERGVPQPFHVIAQARDVRAVKAGTPVKAVIAPVLTTSPESIRRPPSQPPTRPQRPDEQQQQQRRRVSSPTNSSLASNSPAGSLSSSPETRLSHESVPTPPTSPVHGGRKTEQGRPKLKIVTSTVGDNQVPQVTIEPLRLTQHAAQGRKPEFARLLFAAGIAGSTGSQSQSSLSVTSATTTEAVEDVFSPAAPPIRPEHPPTRQVSVPPPAIVITSPQVEWEGEEQPAFSPMTQFAPEDDEDDGEYGSDEQDQGDYSDHEGDLSEEEDLASVNDEDEDTYSHTEELATPTRAIALDLHLPLTMSTSHPPLPSGFPSSVTFNSNTSNASASPTQGLPMTFTSRRELTSPTGFPQSPCESEVEFDDPEPGDMAEGLEGLGFSPVLGHPIMQHPGKGSASFRVLELDRASPVPVKRPQTAEERLKGLGIGTVRLPTITVTEWAEDGLMRF
ncbi:hypothetical protein CALCODRAFT_495834 [Calocera cornea HHB12733]|uniref:Uncharacterized protein n=1 Tax=Calocera cornea HHB12733 TaxID=1353952 RepID=A0A165G9Q1_9BASI|nr:hypothetical protein CALCODRAFT_495834 [Calocera cornea HHB12733]